MARYPTTEMTGTITKTWEERARGSVFHKAMLLCGDGEVEITTSYPTTFALIEEAEAVGGRVRVTLGQKPGLYNDLIIYKVEPCDDDSPDSEAVLHDEPVPMDWETAIASELDLSPDDLPQPDDFSAEPDGTTIQLPEPDGISGLSFAFAQQAAMPDPFMIWKTNIRLAIMQLAAHVVPPVLVPMTTDEEANAMNVHTAQLTPEENARRVISVYRLLAAEVLPD